MNNSFPFIPIAHPPPPFPRPMVYLELFVVKIKISACKIPIRLHRNTEWMDSGGQWVGIHDIHSFYFNFRTNDSYGLNGLRLARQVSAQFEQMLNAESGEGNHRIFDCLLLINPILPHVHCGKYGFIRKCISAETVSGHHSWMGTFIRHECRIGSLLDSLISCDDTTNYYLPSADYGKFAVESFPLLLQLIMRPNWIRRISIEYSPSIFSICRMS